MGLGYFEWDGIGWDGDGDGRARVPLGFLSHRHLLTHSSPVLWTSVVPLGWMHELYSHVTDAFLSFEAVLMLLIQVPGPCLFFPFSSFSLPSWPPFVVPYQLPPSTMAMTPGPTIWVRRIWSWSGRELGSNVSNTCGLPQVGV